MNEGLNIAISIEQAEIEIRNIMQQVSAMGGNDVEIPALEHLSAEMKAGRLPPADAVEEAHRIKSSKMEYH